MIVPFVDLSRTHSTIREEILAAIGRIIDSSSFVFGPYVSEFEEQFAAYVSVGHCVSCANGTDALELALEGLGIGPGHEVIVPVHSWIATAAAVQRVGAKPVFVDTLPDEFTIAPDLIEVKITPRTKAIIAVHLYGLPCRMDEIMRIAGRHHLYVIEDCAQAYGAVYEGKKVGSIGDVGCFSFYPSKNLGAMGDAGAITTGSGELAQKLRTLKNAGQSAKNVISTIGRNSRMDGIQAAVLSIKLKYLDGWNKERRKIAAQYARELGGLKGIVLPRDTGNEQNVYHLYVVRAQKRAELMKYLGKNGIGSDIHYPFLLSSCFHDAERYPVAEKYLDEIISLPMYVGMREEEIKFVADAVKSFYA